MSAQANWDSEQYNDPIEIIKKIKQKCTKLTYKTVKKFKQKQARSSTAKKILRSIITQLKLKW